MKTWTPKDVLALLDKCCETFTFPMLNNGYIYLAATRLSLYRSVSDWAIVIEVFGFSPRAGMPNTSVQTFASRLHARDRERDYVNRMGYDMYLANNPNNEFRNAFPVAKGPWQDPEDLEFLGGEATAVELRGKSVQIPNLDEYERHSIALEEPPRVRVFEFCRYLADIARDQVLATPQERRVSILPDMNQILQLEEWHHPDVADDELPSQSATFQQLAEALLTGDVTHYRPTQLSNTHWCNWPDGGQL
jgi:hypothetical protein